MRLHCEASNGIMEILKRRLSQFPLESVRAGRLWTDQPLHWLVINFIGRLLKSWHGIYVLSHNYSSKGVYYIHSRQFVKRGSERKSFEPDDPNNQFKVPTRISYYIALEDHQRIMLKVSPQMKWSGPPFINKVKPQLYLLIQLNHRSNSWEKVWQRKYLANYLNYALPLTANSKLQIVEEHPCWVLKASGVEGVPEVRQLPQGAGQAA